MFKNITIKFQLLVIPIMIILSFILIYSQIISSFTKLDDKAYKANQANKMIKNILEARLAEKNFIRRKDNRYVQELKKLLHQNISIAQELEKSFSQKKSQLLMSQTKDFFHKYLLSFEEYQNVKKESTLLEKEMIKEARIVSDMAMATRAIIKRQRKKLIRKKADLQKIVKKIQQASLSNKIIKELQEIRIAEKNYITRKDNKYLIIINHEISEIHKITTKLKEQLKSPVYKEMITSIDLSLVKYKQTFLKFSDLREKSFLLADAMKINARKAKNLATQMRLNQKQEREKIKDSFYQTLAILFIVIGIIIIIISSFISLNITRKLKEINKAAQNLASGDGDLTKRIIISGKNEIAEVAHSINEFIEKVQNAISQSKIVSHEASSISNELSTTSLQIGTRVEDQSVLVENVNTNVSTTMKDSEFVADIIQKMYKNSDQSVTALTSTMKQITTLIQTVRDSSQKEIELSQKMEELRNNTNDVKNILEIIGDIAEQTNLLALNAAIEAARAGEHGRGFAVVADEVRKLAERTQKSLVEINATINVVTQGVEDASDNMQENAKEVTSAAEQAGDVETSIDAVMNSIEQTKQMALESSQSVEKLSTSMHEITSKMGELNSVSNANARSVEEISVATEHQDEIISKLNVQLSSFKS